MWLILGDIVGNYTLKNIIGKVDIEISGINHDSRLVVYGNMFVAQRGFTVDGHKYIDQAIKNGAIAIVVEEEMESTDGVTTIYVNDSTDALGYFSRNYYKDPSNSLKVIGITGTNGKTSTSYYLKSILDCADKKTAIIGTIGVIIENTQLKLENTTPDSLTIQNYLNIMLEKGIKYCIMEVSSHALDLKRVDYINFYTSIFTNLSLDHLDYHKTMENYFNSKKKLFYKTKGTHIINIDDDYGKRLFRSNNDRMITYGIKENANVYATNIEYFISGTKFILHTPLEHIEIYLNTIGEFNLYNALAATACAYSLTIDIETIKLGLEALVGIKGRFEIIKTNTDFTVIIDFAHTPDGLEKVLKTIRSLSKERIIVVFGAGGNRDQSKRPEMGEIVGRNSDVAIITSDNPRYENPTKIINDIETGIKRTKKEYITIVNRKKAIEYAIKIAKTNDIILLAGKGHETYTIVGDKIFDFDERQLIMNIIRGK